MIGVSRSLKSHVSKTNSNLWYIYTPGKEHSWTEDWETAMYVANKAAREYQIAYLRDA